MALTMAVACTGGQRLAEIFVEGLLIGDVG